MITIHDIEAAREALRWAPLEAEDRATLMAGLDMLKAVCVHTGVTYTPKGDEVEYDEHKHWFPDS
jgi:hypothetical protein